MARSKEKEQEKEKESETVANDFSEVGNFSSGSNPYLVDFDPTITIITEGYHIAALVGVEFKTSQAGNKMFVLQFEIHEDSPFTGMKMWYNLVPLPQTLWKTNQIYAALGLTPGKGVDLRTAVGKVVKIMVYHDEWDGEARPKIKDIHPFEGKIDVTPTGFQAGPVPGIRDADDNVPF